MSEHVSITADADKLIAKIRALLGKTVENGCTEAESLAAAQMAGMWIDKHGFTSAELALEEKEQIGTKSFKATITKFGVMRNVSRAVADFCDCRSWLYTNSERFEYFGHESDALLATYLMACFDRAFQTAWHEHRREGGVIIDPATGRPKANVSNKDRGSFELGMAIRLNERLGEMKAARNAHVDEGTGRTGTSLVVCKKQAVDAAFVEAGIKLGKSRGGRSRTIKGGAFRAGRAAGDRVHITTGIAA